MTMMSDYTRKQMGLGPNPDFGYNRPQRSPLGGLGQFLQGRSRTQGEPLESPRQGGGIEDMLRQIMGNRPPVGRSLPPGDFSQEGFGPNQWERPTEFPRAPQMDYMEQMYGPQNDPYNRPTNPSQGIPEIPSDRQGFDEWARRERESSAALRSQFPDAMDTMDVKPWQMSYDGYQDMQKRQPVDPFEQHLRNAGQPAPQMDYMEQMYGPGSQQPAPQTPQQAPQQSREELLRAAMGYRRGGWVR